ncbi:hypothetical protein B0H19DRAFT_1063398 [Mycena capillaripes]|nr:hypothetical protein B0H19DRAFT_1063398 [Mycena capillaripes]
MLFGAYWREKPTKMHPGNASNSWSIRVGLNRHYDSRQNCAFSGISWASNNANVAPEAQPWPSSIADIIPSPGAEHDVLVALVQWAMSVSGGHSVFVLIGAFARFWEPFASLLFTTPGVFLLGHALDSYDPDAGPAETMNDFISPILSSCAQGLFHTMSDIDMSAMVEITAKIYPEMYAITGPIEPIFARMNGLSTDDSRRWLSLWVLPHSQQAPF